MGVGVGVGVGAGAGVGSDCGISGRFCRTVLLNHGKSITGTSCSATCMYASQMSVGQSPPWTDETSPMGGSASISPPSPTLYIDTTVVSWGTKPANSAEFVSSEVPVLPPTGRFRAETLLALPPSSAGASNAGMAMDNVSLSKIRSLGFARGVSDCSWNQG